MVLTCAPWILSSSPKESVVEFSCATVLKEEAVADLRWMGSVNHSNNTGVC